MGRIGFLPKGEWPTLLLTAVITIAATAVLIHVLIELDGEMSKQITPIAETADGRLQFIDNAAGPITCPYCCRVTHRGDEKQGANTLMPYHLAARHPETDVRDWPVFEWGPRE